MVERFQPKNFSPSDDQEEEGNLILQNLLHDEKRVRLSTGGNDKTPNRDGFIELRNASTVVGKLEVQIKPVDSRKSKVPGYQLGGHLVGYSGRSGLPFILLCYDRTSKKGYWKQIEHSLFDGVPANQQSVRINFATEDEITNGNNYFEKWSRINQEHLENLALGLQFRNALPELSERLPAGLDATTEMATQLQKIIDGWANRFKGRFEDAQNLFRDHHIAAATSLVSNLEKEISSENGDSELLLRVKVLLGNCHIRLEQYDLAENYFLGALNLNQDSHRAQSNLAHIYYIRNKESVECLNLAKLAYQAKNDDEFTIGVYLLALSFNANQSDLNTFVADKESTISKSSVLQLTLAQCAKENEDFSKAREHFERAIELNPSNFTSRILLAEAIYKGIRQDASKSLKKNILPALTRYKADLVDAMNQIELAVAQLVTTEDRIGLCRSYELGGLLQMIEGEFANGIIFCDRALGVDPKRRVAQMIKVQLLIQLEKYKEAISILESLDTKERDSRQALAYSNYKLKNFSHAADFFTQYIEEIDSDFEWIAYAQSLWFSNKKKKAYQVAMNLRLQGRAPVSIMREIELRRLFDKEEWAAAIGVLELLKVREPKAAEHWLNILAMNMNLGRLTQALEAYGALPLDLIQADGWARPKLAELRAALRHKQWL